MLYIIGRDSDKSGSNACGRGQNILYYMVVKRIIKEVAHRVLCGKEEIWDGNICYSIWMVH